MAMKQPVSINGVEFDALISSEESYSSDIPQYPVEEGYCVSDNITNQPMKLNLTLFLTNTPVTHRFTHGIYPMRVEMVMAQLLALRDKKEPVTIVTCDKTYKNMGLISISNPKAVKGAREITLEFTEVIITYTEAVGIPESYGKSGSTGTSAGTASTTSVASTPVSGGASTTSTLASLTGISG